MGKIKVSLVNLIPPYQKDIYPPLGILSVASALRQKGVDVLVFHEYATKRGMDIILNKSWGSLFVGISVLTGKTIIQNLELSRMLKTNGIPVLWGGIHPTFLPECTLKDESIDYIIMGEGEKSVCEFTERLSVSKNLLGLKGFGYKNNGSIILNEKAAIIEDLNSYKINWDDIFIPNYLRIENSLWKFFPYLTSRGCPHRCGFCYNLDFNQRRWRALNADSVVKDILDLRDKYKIDGIDFIDDNFFTDKKRAFSIAQGIDMPWMAEVRPDYVDEDFVRECKKRNCYKLIIGCESGSDRTLGFIQKDVVIRQIENTINLCYRYGIKVYCSFMILLPGERNEDRNKTIKFIDGLMDRYPGIEIDGPKTYTPYPGTPLYNVSKEIGWQEPDSLYEWSKYHRSMDPSLLGYVKHRDKNKYKVLLGALSVKRDILMRQYSRKRGSFITYIFYLFFNLFKKVSEWRLKKEIILFPLDIKFYILFVFISQRLNSLMSRLAKGRKK